MGILRTAAFAGLMLGAAAESILAQEMTVALTGDAIITRRISVYDEPDFLEMIELIRGADAAFTNLEMLFHDTSKRPGNRCPFVGLNRRPEFVLATCIWAIPGTCPLW